MPKRAAIIVTDADVGMLFCDNGDTVVAVVTPSEQLLADLRLLAGVAKDYALLDGDADLHHAVARVRALLPEEGDDE